MEVKDEGAFNRIIAEIDRPEIAPERHLSIELDEAVKAITRAAAASGKKAKLTLVLEVKPQPDNRREWTHDVKLVLPRLPRAPITLYADQEGEPYDHNPLHAAGPLPGVNVSTPKRRGLVATLETPANAKR